MNIYLLGMALSMAVYILIGIVVSRRIKNAEDYYVAGRRAPVILIAGSLIASYTSTGMFMGDAAEFYSGLFSPMIILSAMQTAGYIFGAILFGRYLRRSRAMTIPEFFGMRFCSVKVRKLAAATAIITMTVYLLSVLQGISTLMHVVTGLDYNLCASAAMIVLTFVTVISGSSGVLITDTLMASLFTLALIVSAFVVAGRAGGWFGGIRQIAADPGLRDLLSWGGRPEALYSSGIHNILWGVVYGIVWMSVCMVGPWQSSRYLMAKDESTVIRSALPSAVGIFLCEFLTGMTAVFVNLLNPSLEDPSQVMIWTAMNVLPAVLGVLLLTGVLAAGISSATTFLSLIGASVANDLIGQHDEKSIRAGQITMLLTSAIVLLFAVFNPPSIFWIMFLGGAIVASSWMPVAVGSILFPGLTRTGAFCGMLAGFTGCFFMRIYASVFKISLPVWLDPSVVGIFCNCAGMLIGSAFTSVSPEEQRARKALFVVPPEEKKPEMIRRTLRSSRMAMLLGVVVTAVLLIFWAIPFVRA